MADKNANQKPIAPVTVGNPDEVDDLAIDQAHLEEYCKKVGQAIAVNH